MAVSPFFCVQKLLKWMCYDLLVLDLVSWAVEVHFIIFKMYFSFFMCMGILPIDMYLGQHACHACDVQKGTVESLELELQTALSTVWVLGNEFQSSGRAATSPASHPYTLKCFVHVGLWQSQNLRSFTAVSHPFWVGPDDLWLDEGRTRFHSSLCWHPIDLVSFVWGFLFFWCTFLGIFVKTM